MKKEYIKTFKQTAKSSFPKALFRWNGKFFMQYTLLLLLVVNISNAQTNITRRKTNDNIFQVMSTSQEYIPTQPWQKDAAMPQYGYGINIGNGKILTTENLVRNSNLIELRREQRGRKIRAKVLIADPQVDLAILQVINPPLDWPQKPQQLISKIKLKEDLTILQFDSTYQIQKSEAQLIKISMTPLPNAKYSSLSFKLLTDLNVNGEGAPVMKNNLLAGLMISYSDSTRTGYMIPYPVIKRFLDDASENNYTGFAMGGFIWKPLIDPTKRSFFGAPRENTGIQILRCIPESGAFQVFKKNDVIIEMDNYKIDSLGFYNDSEFGRLHFSYIIKGQHFPGETIPVKLIRHGRTLTVQLPLTHIRDYTSLIPENITGKRPEYLMQGGLVIRELTGRYLQSYGSDWRNRLNARLVQYYQTRSMISTRKGQHLVILAKVLPHPINVGYQGYENRIITAVNSRPINNMSDVFRIVNEDGGLRRITLQSIDIDFVLDKEELDSANEQIMNTYGIPSLKYQEKTIHKSALINSNSVTNQPTLKE
jgi:S1-C subfamily serine protease